jgi:hypothetical protein
VVNGVAKWDGLSWSALGGGVSGSLGVFSFPIVEALAVFHDGGGAALYAGGSFTTAGGIPAANIARWNGTTWSALGSGSKRRARSGPWPPSTTGPVRRSMRATLLDRGRRAGEPLAPGGTGRPGPRAGSGVSGGTPRWAGRAAPSLR